MRARSPEERLAVALDFEELDPALDLTRRLKGLVRTLKIGPRLFVGHGAAAIAEVRALGFEVFLDMKFHDIPATVGGACRAASRLGVRYLTVHIAGGEAMMRAAVEGAREGGGTEPAVLGITVLTSRAVANTREVTDLARAGRDAGLRGVVASARELPALRRELGDRPLIVTPGIRPAGGDAGDQKRVATPARAIAAGADLLVVGRPIYQAADPRAAAEAILDEIRAESAG
ncbi:MAG: orotidine-5'-phosphate decarboxylase [Gemmatimonadetes bacterium]|nr:orotidine-5'-phosphate decarboxylase [Gemmatimonadota bacterium]